MARLHRAKARPDPDLELKLDCFAHKLPLASAYRVCRDILWLQSALSGLPCTETALTFCNSAFDLSRFRYAGQFLDIWFGTGISHAGGSTATPRSAGGVNCCCLKAETGARVNYSGVRGINDDECYLVWNVKSSMQQSSRVR